MESQVQAEVSALWPRRLFGGWSHIAGRGALVVSDQALFSGANFLLSILLARWMSTTEYGAYSLAYAVFLLFSSMHAALLTEPMMVFGAGKRAADFPHYLRLLVRGHFLVTIPASLVLAASSFGLARIYSPRVGIAFAGLAVASPAILLFWITRRVPYVVMQPGWGVIGGAVYMPLLLGSGALLYAAGQLGSVAAYVAMGAASLVASLVLLPRFIRPAAGRQNFSNRLQADDAAYELKFSDAAHDHWQYGRWAVGTAAIQWFPGHVYYALLPVWLGLDGSAGLRALMNFVMPVTQAISALTMLLIPMLVRDRIVSVGRMQRTMVRFLALFSAGSLVYLAGLWIFRDQVFSVFYAGKYSQYAGVPLLLTGLLPAGTCVTAVLGSALRALERPDLVFWCSSGSLIGAMLAGIPLAAAYGVSGALAGLLVSAAITVVLMSWFYLQAARRAQ